MSLSFDEKIQVCDSFKQIRKGFNKPDKVNYRCGGLGMGIDNENCIERLAFYKGRYGETEILDIKLLNEDKIEQGIEELRKLWKLESFEKVNCSKI